IVENDQKMEIGDRAHFALGAAGIGREFADDGGRGRVVQVEDQRSLVGAAAADVAAIAGDRQAGVHAAGAEVVCPDELEPLRRLRLSRLSVRYCWRRDENCYDHCETTRHRELLTRSDPVPSSTADALVGFCDARWSLIAGPRVAFGRALH